MGEVARTRMQGKTCNPVAADDDGAFAHHHALQVDGAVEVADTRPLAHHQVAGEYVGKADARRRMQLVAVEPHEAEALQPPRQQQDQQVAEGFHSDRFR